MAYCTNCGEKLPDQARFCSKCGQATNFSSEKITRNLNSEEKNDSANENQASNDGWLDIITDSENPGCLKRTGCFKRGFGIVLLLIIIILMITNPNITEFKQYLYDDNKYLGAQSVIDHLDGRHRRNYILFSYFDVQENLGYGLEVYDRYLGIFNTYIQIY